MTSNKAVIWQRKLYVNGLICDELTVIITSLKYIKISDLGNKNAMLLM